MEPGTLGASFDGTPGDLPAAQDITGVALPEMGAAPPPPPPAEAAVEIQAPTPRKGRTAQDRIAQLVRRYHDEKNYAQDLQVQLSRLTETIERQNQQMNELRTRPIGLPQSAVEDPLKILEGQAAPNPSPSANDIAGIVNRALESYDSKRRQAEATQAQLNQAQMASFEEACDELPELRDARTTAYKTFQQVYNSSPLRTLPDAPFQIALQVKGILADEARTAPTPERKAQVSSASTVIPVSTQDLTDVNRATLQKRYDELSQKMKKGETDPHMYVAWRRLRDQLKQKAT